jgi:hypothetical protein
MTTVVIERSPSAAIEITKEAALDRLRKKYPAAEIILYRYSNQLDLKDFLYSVEASIEHQMHLTPEAKICLDFNTMLLGLFQRLENASTADQTQGKKNLKELAEALASKYPIYGLKLGYGTEAHLKFAVALIQPFTASKLSNLRLEAAVIKPYKDQMLHVR